MSSQLVTGDAVVLGLRPARLPSRALAVAMDLTVVVGLYLLLSVVLLSAVLPLGTATAAAVQVALLVLVVVGGPMLVETLSHGRSLGKLVLGLRVVREDGGPIRFRHALVRGAIGFVELLLTAGSVACIASLVSARGRRLGDVFAGTLVVRERIPAGRRGAVPAAPPELAGHFAQLDLSQVPDELWLTVRRFLTRVEQLDQAVAWSMGVRLASDVAGRVGAPAPEGAHPVGYLAAAVAERQRREAERALPEAAPADGISPAWIPTVCPTPPPPPVGSGFAPIVSDLPPGPGGAAGGGHTAPVPPAEGAPPERRKGFAPPF
ncbi:RDD family protein [Streptomyces sp. NBRC 109706]|uniref:RDD family protein n=1 Tax=Streptomyces sp. NBRC 109706 TaxID=1550035 RepID=UPI0007806C0A|nr:RDD family protein [Streptomyces sp. NBRC 109706]